MPLELLVERDGVDSLLGASRATVTSTVVYRRCDLGVAADGCVRVAYLQRLATLTDIDNVVDMEVDFRMAGTIRRRKELINALERDPNSVDFSRERPTEIVFLLKHFLCELPDPLMTSKLQGLFIAAAGELEKLISGLYLGDLYLHLGLPNDEERKRLLHMLTLILPKCHRDTLEVLLVFLKRVSSFTTVRDNIGTDSYSSNLADVIGPNVLFSGNWVHMPGQLAGVYRRIGGIQCHGGTIGKSRPVLHRPRGVFAALA